MTPVIYVVRTGATCISTFFRIVSDSTVKLISGLFVTEFHKPALTILTLTRHLCVIFQFIFTQFNYTRFVTAGLNAFEKSTTTGLYQTSAV